MLFGYDWDLVKSPAGAWQWIPTDPAAADTVPDAHDPEKKHAPIMFTTDLALKEDPSYREISQRFLDNPEEFELAFAKAWFKIPGKQKDFELIVQETKNDAIYCNKDPVKIFIIFSFALPVMVSGHTFMQGFVRYG